MNMKDNHFTRRRRSIADSQETAYTVREAEIRLVCGVAKINEFGRRLSISEDYQARKENHRSHFRKVVCLR
jgi:hypothetical protein